MKNKTILIAGLSSLFILFSCDDISSLSSSLAGSSGSSSDNKTSLPISSADSSSNTSDESKDSSSITSSDQDSSSQESSKPSDSSSQVSSSQGGGSKDDISYINATFETKTIEKDNSFETTVTITDTITSKKSVTKVNDPLKNPYLEIDTIPEKKLFYESYEPAQSYIDSQYRTEAGLLSGDKEESKIFPKENQKKDVSKVNSLRSTTWNYLVDSDSSQQKAYVFYDLDGNFTFIYKGGAYWTMNECCAYCLAFGSMPVNQDYDKYEEKQDLAYDTWYRYGRVNRGYYDGPVKDKYSYETYFVGMKEQNINYTETDFGNGTSYNQTVYDPQYKVLPYNKPDHDYKINTGTAGDRGVLRICFTSSFENDLPKAHKASHSTSVTDKNFTDTYYRRVYYTYNHYNDWSEFLNYEDGFTEIYGNMTRGNSYNSSDVHSDRYFAPIPEEKTINDIISSNNA